MKEKLVKLSYTQTANSKYFFGQKPDFGLLIPTMTFPIVKAGCGESPVVLRSSSSAF